MTLVATRQVSVEASARTVADGGRLAGENESAAGPQHSHHLAQRQLDVGNVVQHSMSDHKVERVVVIGDAFGVGDPAVDVEAQRLPVAGGDFDHPRATDR